MAFLFPKPPKPVAPAIAPAPPTPPTPASSPIRINNQDRTDFGFNPASLISTSASGLRRKASTIKTSLIGG